jgi:S-adenosylmethionine decarboxylase
MDSKKDFFIEKEGIRYSGSHVIVDVYGAKNLSDIDYMKKFFLESIEICGATLLNIDFHSFGLNSGISGVAILSESHMSVHTWPEYDYFALDIFMCGNCDPKKSIPILKQYFRPERVIVNEFLRGQGV